MESTNDTLNIEMVLALGTCGMLLLTAAIAIFIYLYQRKLIKRKLEYQKIETLLREQELKSAYALLAGQEKAYKQVAEELHDNLGSILVTLNMFADSLQKKTDPEALKSLAKKISDVAAIANDTTRKIAHSLHSGGLQHFGLATAIGELADAVRESSSIQVHTHLQLEPHLPAEVSQECYRMVQEMINNTLKHAHATTINLEMTQLPGQLSIIFEDNGAGFTPKETEPAKGMGLRNLETRVERLGGQLTLDSQKNKGTTLIIEIPLNEHH